MTIKKAVAGLLAVVWLSACATPYASRLIIMQGPEFNQHAYEEAYAACSVMVLRQLPPDQGQQAAGDALLGALLGAALGAAFGAALGDAGLGASLGTVSGGAAGLGTYGEQQAHRQQLYNQALSQCLTTKGYQVLGVGQ